MDFQLLGGLPTVENRPRRSTDGRKCQTQPIDTLPDDALLYVFDFYVAQSSEVETWHTLVHVCRRWRNLVFVSPRRLNLRIECTAKTPVREKLAIWPPLPIVISGTLPCNSTTVLDNMRVALEHHHDRVCRIKLFFKPGLCRLEDMVPSPMLEKPFPMLTDLDLDSHSPFRRLFDPSRLLGVSARLRSLTLSGIEIPDLQIVLLSLPNLVILRLSCIDSTLRLCTIVTVLSTLKSLEELGLPVGFKQPFPEMEIGCSSLLTRTVLPSLTTLSINGGIENSEQFMARIDTPLLDHLDMRLRFFSDWDTVLDTPQLVWFIRSIPMLQQPFQVQIAFPLVGAKITFLFSSPFHIVLSVEIENMERKVPCLSLIQFCSLVPSPIQSSESLCIGEGLLRPDNTRWLELLRQFANVKSLFLSKRFALHVGHALKELVGGRVMEVLPMLENVIIEDSEFEPLGPIHDVMKEFVAARQLSGHPITISSLDTKEWPTIRL